MTKGDKQKKVYRKYTDDWYGGMNLPIIKKVTVSDKEISGLLNIDFDKGLIKSRKGWKTFKGMIKQLDELNRKYKKLKAVGDFTIRLPIKGNL